MNKMTNRQEEIRNILSIRESISIAELAEYLLVTRATIRSDIRILESRNEVSRHNGVVSMIRPYAMNRDVKEKIFINAEKKERIATHAATMIGKSDSIILTSGTTIEALSKHINGCENLNVVTPSVSVALNLAKEKDINISILGGTLHKSSLSVRNEYSLLGLKNIYATKLFFGCDGFDPSIGVFTTSQEEAMLTKAMMKVSGQVILLSDSTKLGKTGFGHICDMRDVDILVTDDDLPEKTREIIENSGVHIEIV